MEWLVILVGIVNPDDEVFETQYKYIRERNVIEVSYDNNDNFWTSMAPLSEKEIRRMNRIRMPKEMRLEFRKEKLAMKK